MSILTRQVHVHDGRITLNDIPFAEDTMVTVTLVPSFPVETAHFWKAQHLTAHLDKKFSSENEREIDERIF
jgi:hypothetical protein